jgi:hypothetical protein
MENVGICYGRLENFTAIGYILLPIGIGTLWSFGIYFLHFGVFYLEKSGNPAPTSMYVHVNVHEKFLISTYLHITLKSPVEAMRH